MTSPVAYAKAFPTETSEGYLWDVSCLDCEKSIGTMHSKTLQSAVIANLDKGGIKCPECRAVSCDICGDNHLLSRGKRPGKYQVDKWPKEVKLCQVCVLALEASGRAVKRLGEDKLRTKELA